MVKTRQRARLEAVQLAKRQEKSVKEDLSDEERSHEPSSDNSGREVLETERVHSDDEKAHSDSEKEQSDDAGTECLPDVIKLNSPDELATKRAPTLSLREKESSTSSAIKPRSRLDPGPEIRGELYFSLDTESMIGGCRKGRSLVLTRPRGHDPHHELMKKSVITADFEKRESAPPIKSQYAIQKMKKVSITIYELTS